MQNPYKIGNTLPPSKDTSTKQPVLLAIIALLFYSGPILGVLFSKALIFSNLSQSNLPDAAVLARQISIGILSVAYGCLMALPGALTIIYLLKKNITHSTFFYKCCIAISIVWLLLLPIGTIIGGYIFYLAKKQLKKHYTDQQQPSELMNPK